MGAIKIIMQGVFRIGLIRVQYMVSEQGGSLLHWEMVQQSWNPGAGFRSKD